MDNQCGRIIGGIYIALSAALSDERARAAHDILYSLSESSLIRPEDQHIYKMIADAATDGAQELRAEIDRCERPHPRFAVIQGGNNAA